MNEVLDRKPPKPVVPVKKSILLQEYLYDERAPSDLECEYSKEIFSSYLAQDEALGEDFLIRQAEFNFRHRAILIDWIHSTHRRFKLAQETLFLAVHILDRYLSRKSIRIHQIQLLGLTVLFMASKYEEVYAPDLGEILKTIDSVFLKDQVIALERDILSSLNFSVTKTTTLTFYSRFSEVYGLSGNMHSFGMYLLELSFDYRLVVFKPSVIAAACGLLAHLLFHKDAECKHRKKIMVDEQVRNSTNQLINVLEFARENPLKSVWDKFSKRRFHCVSSLVLI